MTAYISYLQICAYIVCLTLGLLSAQGLILHECNDTCFFVPCPLRLVIGKVSGARVQIDQQIILVANRRQALERKVCHHYVRCGCLHRLSHYNYDVTNSFHQFQLGVAQGLHCFSAFKHKCIVCLCDLLAEFVSLPKLLSALRFLSLVDSALSPEQLTDRRGINHVHTYICLIISTHSG